MNSEGNNNHQMYYDEYEIDLREYILLLWDNKFFIGGLVILAVIAAFLFSTFFIAPTYQTQARIQLSNYEGLYSNPDTAVQLLSSTDLMQKVMAAENIDLTAAQLNSYINNNLNISQISNTSIITITVKNNEPQLTQNIAEGLISNFEADSNKYFENKLKNDREYISTLKTDLKDLSSDLERNQNLIQESREKGKSEVASLLIQENSSLQDSRLELRREIEERESELENFYPLEVLDAPYLPENPTSPNIKLNVAIAAVLALMLAVFIIFFREFMKEE
ncbi:YveK family protein [Halanaerobium sp. ST460_2HS_T2]|uniref:YveK family protein n=1 Tax=Halanaerobium sp. ST460_2HS_T2 TaxID=2183914 RepID=UPI000DF263F7|nr:Wzz/FepE/Etk N-terminal domain-containing protein [Halanaerobium sp. ST460_2HS_T2]RCW57355.1 subunit length determinant protein [Halanaerobium sp. ST460_2HS_T2]